MGGGEKFSRALARRAVLGEHPGMEARGRGGAWVSRRMDAGRKTAVRQSEGLASRGGLRRVARNAGWPVRTGADALRSDSAGCVRTATEVSGDSSALMCNAARRENVLVQSIASIARALLHIACGFGVDLPQEGDLKAMFDDSIITDAY